MFSSSALVSSLPSTRTLRPEKNDWASSPIEKAAHVITGGFVRLFRSRMSRKGSIGPLVDQCASGLSALTDKELRSEAMAIGIELRLRGFRDDLVARSFAIIRECAERSVGMRHFDSQLMGGWALLRGMVAEMETGEGKTLTATLAAGTAALAGIPVHIICVNDYLTARDAEWMGPVYNSLGLKVGCITHEISRENRQAAYQCNVTYCNNKEITFDYLRDKLVLGELADPLRLQAEYLYSREVRENRLLLRGLHFAIADEADSLLIDEARTPLIISGEGDNREEESFLRQAMSLAEALTEDVHFKVDKNQNKTDLTEKGLDQVQNLSVALGPLWMGTIRRNEAVRKALAAKWLFQKDIHYLVRDGKVQIVDEYTGRMMPDRSWEQGIHQLIEIKEGCQVTKQRESLARITYQRFFRRYLHLCGMTGTAWEVRKELWNVYGLNVVRIPTNRPLIRKGLPTKVLPALEDKDRTILERVRSLNKQGRPVLVGTRSVAVSERLHELFKEAGLSHHVLNAKNDKEEAEIIAGAGQAGAITIATNMAGRGTDIKLGPGVAESQGLHVILTERHEAARIDRQLAGRCARQGDPGSYEAILSAEDPILKAGRGGILGWAVSRVLRPSSLFWTIFSKLTILYAQRKMERIHARIRHELLKQDEKIGTLLSFSGKQE